MATKKRSSATPDTEGRIIEAASRAFSHEGYRGVTTKHIAEAARVNEITIFRRFKSKENVLRRVLAEKGAAALKVLDGALIMDEGVDITSCLRNLSTLASSSMGEGWEMIMPLMEQREIRPLIAEYLFSTGQSMAAKLERFFRFHIEAGNIRGVNPEAATVVFFGYLMSPINRPRLMGMIPSKGSNEKSFNDFIDIFMWGISANRNTDKGSVLKRRFVKK
jgi:TetR/AcrR family transcriptional regulator